jgi:tRNA A37 threonylcarbamoyladenosine dehydratase
MSTKYFAVAVASAAVTAALVDAYHRFCAVTESTGRQQKKNRESLGKHDEELIREQLARNYAFLGEDGMKKVRNLSVVIVGCGGVGSWVCTMLVRSGVSKLRIIDFDQVSLSSLNRHAVATLEDVGTPKVDCLKKHLLKIAPWVEIEAVNQLWHLPQADTLLQGDETLYIVDCIDNIDTKVDLLAYAHEKRIPIISSMGAACKSDPTRINISDISKSEEDPLAKSVRRRLKQKGINTNIPVVFSAEKPDPRKAQLLPLPEDEFQKGKVDELSALRDFRVRILPVLGTMPAMFGLTIVSYILTSISGYPIEPIEGKNRIKIYDGIFQSLAGQQTRIGESEQRVPISLREVPYICEEVFRGKSPISGFSTKLTLSRWDRTKPISLTNVVVMTKDEQKSHEEKVLIGGAPLEEVYDASVLELVAKRFKEEEYYEQFR